MAVATLLGVAIGARAAEEFSLPPGFEIVEFASQDLAPDIYTLTISPRGDLTVAGRGYIRVLKDDDGDGAADRAVEFADSPRDGAMGLWWEGDELLAVGDGGIQRFLDADSDDVADGPPLRVRSLKTGGEHDSHALRRGPDGWHYLLCGNESRVVSSSAELPSSPVKDPVAGALLRFTPDFSRSEIVADGFRNAYDFDFNTEGEIFVFDSDNERDVSLPFYEPTRLYHVTPGFHYGWENPQLARTWRMPPYFFDVDRPIATLGRGSPTGVVYHPGLSTSNGTRGGILLADWTFGRVYFTPLTPDGATYSATPEVFLQSLGETGFAPTDLAVHPKTGDIYISIGGRGTRGAVYRISGPMNPLATTPGASSKSEESPRESLGALAALRRAGDSAPDADSHAAIRANWGSPDRKIRQLTAKLIGDLDRPSGLRLAMDAADATQGLTLAWGLAESAPEVAVGFLIQVLESPEASAGTLVDSVRLIQVLLGDLMALEAMSTIWEGYSRRGPSKLGIEAESALLDALDPRYPSGIVELDFEVARTYAQMESPAPQHLAETLAQIGEDTDPSADIHFLSVLGRLTAKRSPAQTEKIAAALLALDGKVTKRGWNRERHWPWRLGEIYTALSKKDPDLDEAILSHPLFGADDHFAFITTEKFPKGKAARRFIELNQAGKFEWTPSSAPFLEHLPLDEGKPLARELWDSPALRDALVRVLAPNPDEADRGKFFHRLASFQPEVVKISLDALRSLRPPSEAEEWFAVLEAFRTWESNAPDGQPSSPFDDYLRAVSESAPEGATLADWIAAIGKADPGIARLWEERMSAAVGDWKERLAGIDWELGRADEGGEVYDRAGCTSCHTGRRTLGPDLAGVGRRFGREDLLIALIDPSRDIPSQYRTKVVETEDGEIYQGLVVYEAVDSLILQNGPDSTYRIDGEKIVSEHPSKLSIMPSGLLDPLTDREIADLVAYLQALD